MNLKGKVYLVSAGPGDAGLMTLRGAELLAHADVVVYDSLVPTDLLRLASKSVELICLSSTETALKDVTHLLVTKARENKCVVRLKFGNAFIPGEKNDEAQELEAAKISFELIPGISTPAAGSKTSTWFAKRPLFGKRVVVTRSREQASNLSNELQLRGATVLEVPTIKFAPPTDARSLTDALLELNAYDWIVFTSANGVSAFFEFFFKAFDDMRDIGGVRIAAVGPATAAKLKELHLKVDVMPSEYVASKIGKALTDYESIENLKILIVRAEVANPELPKALEEEGAIVDDIACYKTVPETEDINGSAAALVEKGADWITFTSGSTVENFHARFDLPKLLSRHPQAKLASIGPETSKVITALGLKPAFEAKEHTIEGLIRGLERAAQEN